MKQKNSKKKSGRYLMTLLRCKLCWLISLVLFSAMLSTGGLLLIPFHTYFQNQIFELFDQKGLAIARSLITLHADSLAHARTKEFIAAGNLLSKETILAGAALYDHSGNMIARFGKYPKVRPSDLLEHRKNKRYFLSDNKDQLYLFFSEQQLHHPYEVVAIIDSSAVGNLSTLIIREFWDETLFLALLITIISMIVVGFLLLRPIIRAQNQLALAINDPAQPQEYLIQYTPKNELGFIFSMVNKLLIKVGSLIQRLEQQKWLLNKLNNTLESKVEKRTKALLESNNGLKKEIKSRRFAEHELQSMALFPKENSNPVMRISGEGRVLFANRSSAPLLTHWNVKLDELLPDKWKRLVVDLLTIGQAKNMEVICNEQVFLVNFTPIQEQNYLNIYAADITEQKRYEQELKFLSGHNPITGLINRALFENLLAQNIKNCNVDQALVAVLFVSINRFEKINQTLGYSMGDRLLVKIAQRLTEQLPKELIIAHPSKEYFAIAISNLTRSEVAYDYGAQIIGLFQQPFTVAQREIRMGVSIGITLFPLDGETPQQLLRNADLAMSHACSRGDFQCQFFTPGMNQQIEQQHHLLQDFYSAVEERQFIFHYQPQTTLATRNIFGVEALIRWNHPSRGLVRPDEFIPFLERTYLISELTEWMIHEAIKQHIKWKKEGLQPLRIAVNLTSEQFAQNNLINLLKDAISFYKIDPQYLELEITERIAIENPEQSIKIMKTINALGIDIVMDDFGTGYSSLRYLQRLPVSKIKIDKSFIDGIETDTENRIITKAIITLAHNLELKVIAEGVETQNQFDFLLKNGCDEIQGYVISAPMSPERLSRFLKNFKQ